MNIKSMLVLTTYGEYGDAILIGRQKYNGSETYNIGYGHPQGSTTSVLLFHWSLPLNTSTCIALFHCMTALFHCIWLHTSISKWV